ncbi:PepSY-associated TM helix domain-containing protein [Ruegeria arenilitoris]|uniref:PepSY-associated TM helix domain-containing protein n=1 Tax=Ruegeria arenilitoris TaxID=1173585 RepID=UPI00147DCCC5|nr:PepSY-associated TM helix domain-containing protein [Ruegeria arenilitoris]
MTRKFRNQLFRVHTWIGLFLSAFFTFMFLTGTLLVAGFEIESIGRPAIWTTLQEDERTASFGQIYDGIKSAHPEGKAFVILKHPKSWLVDRTFGHTGWGERVSYWTDPTTGTVVYETGDPGFSTILAGLHDTFLIDSRIVFILISAMSIPLLFQMVSGLISYRRFWKGFFRWPSSASGFRIWAGGVHRLTALWAAPLIFLIAITSFFFLLGGLGIEGEKLKFQPPAPRASALPDGFDGTVINAAEAKARAALPGFHPVTLTLPGGKAGSLKFIGQHEDFSHFRGETTVAVDPLTLEVLDIYTPADFRGLARVNLLMEMLHYGVWGGAFSMVLWIVLGFVATALAFTGSLVYAARLAPTASTDGSNLRFWRRMGPLRWVYLLVLLGALFAVSWRLNPDNYISSHVHPVDAEGTVARLILQERLRNNTPIEIELRVDVPGVSSALVEVNGTAAQSVDLVRDGDKALGRFRFEPLESGNEVIAYLKKPDGTEQKVTFRMGSPIW